MDALKRRKLRGWASPGIGTPSNGCEVRSRSSYGSCASTPAGPDCSAWLLQRRQHHANAHDHIVSNSFRIGPLPFADLVIEPLEREVAFGDAVAGGILLERDRHHGIMRNALDRQLPDDFVLIAAEIPDRRRSKMRDRKFRGVEPRRALDLGLQFVTGEVDAAELDVEISFGSAEILGHEHDVGFPSAKSPIDVGAHLPRYEPDLALVDEHALRAGLTSGKEHHPERGNERAKPHHLSPSLRKPQRASELPGSRQHSVQHCIAIDKMVLESHYTVDTDQRQQGEVHARSVFMPAVAAGILASAQGLKVSNSANRTRQVPSRAQPSEAVLLRSRRRRRR